jgi:hypothetical protein
MEKAKNDSDSKDSGKNKADSDRGPAFSEHQGDSTWEVTNTAPPQPPPRKKS